ncbi:MAG: cation:proton antiporter [Thaumarchaeota archaeon]|nr:cation:proton antiporter [Nitrososphaerota archaeon]
MKFDSAAGNFSLPDIFQKAIPHSDLSQYVSGLQHLLYTSIFSGINLGSTKVIFLTIGITILLAVLGDAFFKKTRIPDIIFLVLVGTMVGPILGIVDQASAIKIAPYFAALALITILFNAGLNLEIRTVIRTAHFALFLAVLGFAASVAAVSLLAVYLLGWQWPDAILLGVMLGGSSEAIVVGLVRGLLISEKTKYILSLESIMTGIFSYVPSFLLFGLVISGQFSIHSLGIAAAEEIATGLALGAGIGIPWLYLSSKFAHARYVSLFTLGILFVLYFLANSYGESGALTALVFGIILGNKGPLSRRLRIKAQAVTLEDPFYDRIAFLVRTFFFVFIGLFADFGDLSTVVFGIIATIALYYVRLGAVRATFTKKFSAIDKKVAGLVFPRGLAPALLATYAITMGLPHPLSYMHISYIVILASVVMTTVGLGRLAKHQSGTIADTGDPARTDAH